MENKQQAQPNAVKGWYDKYYKLMLLPPVIVVVLCLVYLAMFYNVHNDFILKDSSLSGGTTITINKDVDSNSLKQALGDKFGNINVREIKDLTTGRLLAVIVDSSVSPEELQPEVEKIIGYNLTEENSNIEFSGPSLGQGFYKQLIIAVTISFVLMSIVIFFMFRSFIPSIAVIFAAFSDILMAITFVDIFGIRLSAAGIAAFLMLIGYSVDTDILLTTRVLKKTGGSVNGRIWGAMKTGLFMTGTGLAAILPAFFIVTGLPDSFRQIFLILGFGLAADIFNTWMTNAGIIKWYAESKGIK